MESEIRDILTAAVMEPEPDASLFTTLLTRFADEGGVDLPVPARSTPVRAADFST